MARNGIINPRITRSFIEVDDQLCDDFDKFLPVGTKLTDGYNQNGRYKKVEQLMTLSR